MKRTNTIATYQLQPTVHIDAVPELAGQRERAMERERGRGGLILDQCRLANPGEPARLFE